MGKRFRKLDLDNSGALSVDEFMSLPELQQNPLVQRVIDIFDADGNGEVDFKEFIQGVSQFSVKGDKLSKLRFAFRIYDMDNDGYISNGELFQVSFYIHLIVRQKLLFYVVNISIGSEIINQACCRNEIALYELKNVRRTCKIRTYLYTNAHNRRPKSRVQPNIRHLLEYLEGNGLFNYNEYIYRKG